MGPEATSFDAFCDQHKPRAVVNQNLHPLSILAEEEIHMTLIHNRTHLMYAVTMKLFKTTAHVDLVAVDENTKTFSI
jgi:hypothetical protein